MPNYKITCVMDRYLDYNVEADSKEEALKIVNEDGVDHYDDYTDYDSSVIHSIKKEED